MHSKMCSYDKNMKPTISVNLRKLQVSHMCRNTLFSTALYKEADLHFFLSSYLAPSTPLPSFQQGLARATQREGRIRESKVGEPHSPRWLNMELDLQSLFGREYLTFSREEQFGKWHPGWGRENRYTFLQCVLILAETPQLPPPPFRLIYEGAIGQPR